MASFQIGSEIAAPLSLTAPFPVDARNVANSVEQVLTEYPSSCRYLGMRIWIESENKLYVFSKHTLSDGTESTGLTDDDFRPFESDGNIEIDGVLSDVSKNPVENRVIYAHMDTLQKKLIVGENMDETPTEGSQSPITSDGVAKAISGLRGQLNYVGYFSQKSDLDSLTGMVNGDWVTIGMDIDHGGQKSKYIFSSTENAWIYNGEVADTQVELNDESVDSDSVWSSKKTNEEIMKQHQPYQAGIPLVAGEMYIESNALYRCLVDVSSDENLAFALLPDGTMELVIGNGEIKQCEYDEPSETLFLNRLTTDMIEYSEDTETLTIFEQ